MIGSTTTPIALSTNTTAVAIAMSLLFALIDDPTAAIADPPQIAVPEEINKPRSRVSFSNRARSNPTIIAPAIVPIASASPSLAA